MAVPRFRSSAKYGRFYAGRAKSVSFLIEKWNAVTLAWDPVALDTYTAVKFQAFLTDAASSLTQNVTLTVDTTNLVSGVKARCSGTVTFSAAASAVRCQLVLVTGSTSEVVEAQWEADVYAGGPTS